MSATPAKAASEIENQDSTFPSPAHRLAQGVRQGNLIVAPFCVVGIPAQCDEAVFLSLEPVQTSVSAKMLDRFNVGSINRTKEYLENDQLYTYHILSHRFSARLLEEQINEFQLKLTELPRGGVYSHLMGEEKESDANRSWTSRTLFPSERYGIYAILGIWVGGLSGITASTVSTLSKSGEPARVGVTTGVAVLGTHIILATGRRIVVAARAKARSKTYVSDVSQSLTALLDQKRTEPLEIKEYLLAEISTFINIAFPLPSSPRF
ncbi:MAG: hypothetical protein EOP09_03445 [Proteobacteria bacterium]|nr:MAG: hypothetical protein EOP09_03445 [Pseudomonadota bacterium]